MSAWKIVLNRRVLISVFLFSTLLFSNSFVYGQWPPATLPSVSSSWALYGVHFTSPDEGWAVGVDDANHTGMLLEYSEGIWTLVSPPPVSSSWGLYGVHFTSPDEGWAVGVDDANHTGVLLQYSGHMWTSVSSLPEVQVGASSPGPPKISASPTSSAQTPNPIIFKPPKSLPPVHHCDTNYTYTFSASGGSGGGFKFQLSSGTLPSGMVLDSTTGILSIPTDQSVSSDIGTYKFSVCAIDLVSQNELCKATSIKVIKRQANIDNFDGSYSGSASLNVIEYGTWTETDPLSIVVANGTATITAGAGQPVTFTGTLTSSGVLAAKWSGFGGHNDVYFDGTGNFKGRFVPVSGQCSFSANGTASFKGKDGKGGTLTMSATWSVSLQ